MKTVIYINKGKIWADGRAYDWTFDTLPEIFVSIKKDLRINEARIVLGSEVSYVVDFKLADISKSRREDVLKMTRGWLPFVVVDECFDWKMVTLGDADVWAQVVAVEPSFLETVSKAIQKSGIRVDWMIPVGIVLGMMSLEKEVPVIIKWKGKENLVVLAQNGLVDYVGSDNDDVVNHYAKQKWHLEVNPEQVLLNDDNFEFNDEVFLGKNKGSDRDVLGLNLFRPKNNTIENIVPKSIEKIVGELLTVDEVTRVESGNKNLFWLVVVLVMSLVVMGGVMWWRFGYNKSAVGSIPMNQPTPEITISVTPEATPTQVLSPTDLNLVKVQILNGSGIAGEAGRLKDRLVELGFADIEVGNNPSDELLTTVSYKSELSADIVALVMENLDKYEIGNILFFTSEKPYDLTIVIGNSVKN